MYSSVRPPILPILLVAGLAALAGAFVLPASWNPSPGALCAATMLLALCVLGSYRYLQAGIAGRGGAFVILTSFIVSYPLSALAHLIGSEDGGARGFYDIVRSGTSGQSELVLFCIFLVAVAFGAMRLGFGNPGHNLFEEPLARTPRLLLVLGLCFTGLGFYGTFQLFGSASSFLTEMSTVTRDREIGGGLARYLFLSRWLSWGLTFLMAALMQSRLIRSRVAVGSAFVGFILMVLANMFWGGGRAESLLAIIPCLFVTTRLRPEAKTFALVTSAVIVAIYIQTVTTLRTQYSESYSSFEQLQAILDWQAGRFSMVGLGVRMAEDYGWSWGSTLPSSLLEALNTPSTLLGLQPIAPATRPITSVIGVYLIGNANINGIVPGTICEFYLNFGILGVLIGYLWIGRFSAMVIKMQGTSRTVGEYAFAAYLLLLIATSIIPATATAWVYNLVTQGFPILCLLLMERLLPGVRTAPLRNHAEPVPAGVLS